jgi:DNA-binding Lrp family transcriptional regulator
MQIDDIDRSILSELRENSRISFRDLSKKLGIPESTIRFRVDKLVKRRIIKQFTILIDETALGYSISALIEIRHDSAVNREELELALKSFKNVILAYSVTGDYDYVVLVKCGDIEELNDIIMKINEISGVGRCRTHVVLSRVKENCALPL